MEKLARYLPKGYPRPISDLAGWELYALERVAERPCRDEKREPIEDGKHWAVAQTVTTMEHLVRRDIEKTNRGTFLPTRALFWKVDGREYSRESPLMGGYVFFLTSGDDWAGIPDILGVYGVLANRDRTPMRVSDPEMKRMMVGHATGEHNETLPPRYTKYYRAPEGYRRKSRKPRASKRLSSFAHA